MDMEDMGFRVTVSEANTKPLYPPRVQEDIR